MTKQTTFTLEDVLGYVKSKKQRSFRHQANWVNYQEEQLKAYMGFLYASTFFTMVVCRCSVVEIGIDVGLSSLSIACAAQFFPSQKMYSFDKRKGCVDEMQEQAKRMGVHNAVFIHGDSSDAASLIASEKQSIAFAYIDGDHSYEGCSSDVRNLAPLLHQRGVIVSHDFSDKSISVNNNGVKKSLVEYMEHNDGWCLLSMNGFGILGRKPAL